LKSFASCFWNVLPNAEFIFETYAYDFEYNFKHYIEETLSKDKGEGKDLTAIEFGGPGSNLFRGFTQGFFSKTAGVCLRDMRESAEKEVDAENNHIVIPGDILDIKDKGVLFKNIREQLHVQKVNLIISRMLGPLSLIDKNLSVFDRILRNWYDLLEENGIMFIQTGLRRNSEVEKEETRKWQKSITTEFPQIKIQTEDDFSLIRLHKGVGSPEHLPAAIKILRKIR
jgi:hypothetical protein